MFSYQTNQRYFAQITDGTAEVATRELESLGAHSIEEGYRGLYFEADQATLYQINYCTRIATRVFAPLVTFDCHSDKYLYRRAQSIPWADMFDVDDTFAVYATVSNSALRHSQYAALKVKDAIVDQFRSATGKRPNVDTSDPDLRINLYIHGNKATISIDTSGGSLHRRGYRIESVEAPIQETVAAAMLDMSEWNGTSPLIDPMCGSGTILAEALIKATHSPAGALREKFGFKFLPDFNHQLWELTRKLLQADVKPLPAGLITGGDIDRDAVRAARTNLSRLPDGRNVEVIRRPFDETEVAAGSVIITNPPYGRRIGTRESMPAFMKRLGDFLKQQCTGSTAYIYFGERELIKQIGLRSTWKKPLANGGLDGRLVKYELF